MGASGGTAILPGAYAFVNALEQAGLRIIFFHITADRAGITRALITIERLHTPAQKVSSDGHDPGDC